MEFHALPIVGLIEEAPRTRTFLFPKPEGLTWEPGAHIHVGLPGFDANGEHHPELVRVMSLCTVEREGRLGFTTRLDSSRSTFKRRLAAAKPGEELTFFKPGSELALRRDGRPVALVSQGVGIAAMRPIILDYAHSQEGVPSLTSLTVDRGPRGIYRDRFAQLERELPALNFQRASHRDELIAALAVVSAPTSSTFHVVGSERFLVDIVAELRRLGVADEEIVLDRDERRRAEILG